MPPEKEPALSVAESVTEIVPPVRTVIEPPLTSLDPEMERVEVPLFQAAALQSVPPPTVISPVVALPVSTAGPEKCAEEPAPAVIARPWKVLRSVAKPWKVELSITAVAVWPLE